MSPNQKTLLLSNLRTLFLFLGVSIFFLPSVFGQRKITITEYLESTFNANNVKTNAEEVAFFENLNYNLPLINSIDLRTETNEFLIDQEDYSMRISPNSFKAMALQKKLYKNKLEKVGLDNQLEFNQELKKRYLLIIDSYFIREITKLGKKRKGLEEDKLSILGKSIYNSNFDIKDLIESEDELLSIELKLANLKDIQDGQKYQLQQLFNTPSDSLQLDYENLIGVEQVINVPQPSLNKDHVEIQSQKLKIATLENEMALKKANASQILDFVQAKYQTSALDEFNENFSVGIGFSIPWFGNNRKDKGDYYFEKLEEETELKTLEDEVNYDLLAAQDEFKNAVMNYQVMNAQLKSSSVSSILESYKSMEGVSPIVLLNLLSLQSKKELEVLQLKHQLYKKYIAVLDLKETLYQQPLRNYLSPYKDYITN